MPPSVITTSGSSTIVTASALSYPANADPLTYLPYDTPQLITSSGPWRHPKPGFPINLYCVLLGGGGGGGGRNTGGVGGGGGGSGYITFVELSNVIANITATINAAMLAKNNINAVVSTVDVTSQIDSDIITYTLEYNFTTV